MLCVPFFKQDMNANDGAILSLGEPASLEWSLSAAAHGRLVEDGVRKKCTNSMTAIEENSELVAPSAPLIGCPEYPSASSITARTSENRHVIVVEPWLSELHWRLDMLYQKLEDNYLLTKSVYNKTVRGRAFPRDRRDQLWPRDVERHSQAMGRGTGTGSSLVGGSTQLGYFSHNLTGTVVVDTAHGRLNPPGNTPSYRESHDKQRPQLSSAGSNSAVAATTGSSAFATTIGSNSGPSTTDTYKVDMPVKLERPGGISHLEETCNTAASQLTVPSHLTVHTRSYGSEGWNASIQNSPSAKMKIAREWREKCSGGAANMLDLTRFIQERSNVGSRRAAMAWRFMEDKNSSRAARAYFYVRDVFLLLATLIAFADLNEWSSSPSFFDLEYVQLWIEILFAVELSLRAYFAPHRQVFWFNFYNVIDLVSALPIALRIYILMKSNSEDSDVATSLLGVVPVLRMLKVMRYFETFQLLLHAFQIALKVLPVLLFTLFILVITWAALVYYIEPRDNIPTMRYSMYFVMITLSTVGFGDITPETEAGRVCTTLLIVSGSIYMAIPLGIVGKTFGDVWDNRNQLIALQRIRNCVESAGYTEKDLKILFMLFDSNGDGMLDSDEFTALLNIMQVNVDQKLVQQVFQSFDESDSNCVDFQELVHGLYPTL